MDSPSIHSISDSDIPDQFEFHEQDEYDDNSTNQQQSTINHHSSQTSPPQSLSPADQSHIDYEQQSITDSMYIPQLSEHNTAKIHVKKRPFPIDYYTRQIPHEDLFPLAPPSVLREDLSYIPLHQYDETHFSYGKGTSRCCFQLCISYHHPNHAEWRSEQIILSIWGIAHLIAIIILFLLFTTHLANDITAKFKSNLALPIIIGLLIIVIFSYLLKLMKWIRSAPSVKPSLSTTHTPSKIRTIHPSEIASSCIPNQNANNNKNTKKKTTIKNTTTNGQDNQQQQQPPPTELELKLDIVKSTLNLPPSHSITTLNKLVTQIQLMEYSIPEIYFYLDWSIPRNKSIITDPKLKKMKSKLIRFPIIQYKRLNSTSAETFVSNLRTKVDDSHYELCQISFQPVFKFPPSQQYEIEKIRHSLLELLLQYDQSAQVHVIYSVKSLYPILLQSYPQINPKNPLPKLPLLSTTTTSVDEQNYIDSQFPRTASSLSFQTTNNEQQQQQCGLSSLSNSKSFSIQPNQKSQPQTPTKPKRTTNTPTPFTPSQLAQQQLEQQQQQLSQQPNINATTILQQPNGPSSLSKLSAGSSNTNKKLLSSIVAQNIIHGNDIFSFPSSQSSGHIGVDSYNNYNNNNDDIDDDSLVLDIKSLQFGLDDDDEFHTPQQQQTPFPTLPSLPLPSTTSTTTSTSQLSHNSTIPQSQSQTTSYNQSYLPPPPVYTPQEQYLVNLEQYYNQLSQYFYTCQVYKPLGPLSSTPNTNFLTTLARSSNPQHINFNNTIGQNKFFHNNNDGSGTTSEDSDSNNNNNTNITTTSSSDQTTINGLSDILPAYSNHSNIILTPPPLKQSRVLFYSPYDIDENDIITTTNTNQSSQQSIEFNPTTTQSSSSGQSCQYILHFILLSFSIPLACIGFPYLFYYITFTLYPLIDYELSFYIHIPDLSLWRLLWVQDSNLLDPTHAIILDKTFINPNMTINNNYNERMHHDDEQQQQNQQHNNTNSLLNAVNSVELSSFI